MSQNVWATIIWTSDSNFLLAQKNNSGQQRLALISGTGYIQYNYDAGTSLHWYELTLVRVDYKTYLIYTKNVYRVDDLS